MALASGTKWKPGGEDQIYLYHKLIDDPHLDYSNFEKQHADWLTTKGYLKRNLRTNFKKSKDRLKKFYTGECKFCCLYCFIFIDARTNEFNYETFKNEQFI